MHKCVENVLLEEMVKEDHQEDLTDDFSFVDMFCCDDDTADQLSNIFDTEIEYTGEGGLI